MIETLHFYNHFHNGDVHYSRGFVRRLMALVPAKRYVYAHNNPADLLADIPHLEHLRLTDEDTRRSFDMTSKRLRINTWIGQQDGRFLPGTGVSFRSNYRMYSELCDWMGIERLRPDECLPSIDFSRIPTDEIELFWTSHQNRPMILVSDGPVLSGQSDNFDFQPLILAIAARFPKILFLCTHGRLNASNILHSSDITRTAGCDLNQIGLLATRCSMVIGRASGPFCFAQTRDTLNDPRKTFVVFSHSYATGVWHDGGNSKMIWSNRYAPESIIAEIDAAIRMSNPEDCLSND
jgi:hypothetical protein